MDVPPTGEVGHARIFDTDAVHERLQLDDELLRQVLQVFVDDLPARRGALAAALASGGTEAAAQWAHTLKGTAANLVFPAVAEASAAFESALRSGQEQGIRVSRENLERALDELAALLVQRLQGRP